MTEVTSVNGQTGAVVLTPADVEAIPAADLGEASGVATLDVGGKLTGAQLPTAAVTESGEQTVTGGKTFNGGLISKGGVVVPVANDGNVSGTYAPNLEAGSVRKGTITGAVTLEAPTHWPTGSSEATIILTQNSEGGHSISVGGGIAASETPQWSTAPNAANIFTLWSPDGGTNVYLFVGPQGPEGKEGKEGPEGKEGKEGKAGQSSIESMTQVSFPYVCGNAAAVASFKFAEAWKTLFNLIVCPVKKKKLKVYLPTKKPGSGQHVRASVWDVGVTTAGSYTCLAAGALYEPLTENAWELVATLEKASGEWEPGELLMLGIGVDNTTTELYSQASGAALGNGALWLVPGASIAGASGLTNLRLLAAKTYTESGFKETLYKSLTEGSIGSQATPMVFAARWE